MKEVVLTYLVMWFKSKISYPLPLIYSQAHKSKHPISKVLQWLAWYAAFWARHWWSHILLCWGRFLYVYTLTLSMPIFKKKSARILLVEILADFFLKIGILSAKVYTKNVPNIGVCNLTTAPPRTLSVKQVIVLLY